MFMTKEKKYNATTFIKKIAEQKLKELTEETISKQINSDFIIAIEKGYFRLIKKNALEFLQDQRIQYKNNRREKLFDEIINKLEEQHF